MGSRGTDQSSPGGPEDLCSVTALLLDHPWPLDAALDPRSDGFRVLERFRELVTTEGLEIVPFISRDEYNQMWDRIARTTGWASVARFAAQFVREDSPPPLATPVPEPPGLTQCWKGALREAMGDLQNWRNPQIIIARRRRPVWPCGDEVEVRVHDGLGRRYDRVLAELDSYRSHPFAISDLDPWDLQHIHRPVLGVPRQYPHSLPKPPSLQGCPIEQLSERLPPIRARGWQINGRFYFIPPEDWRPDQSGKAAWRSGRAFLHERVPGLPNTGPVDSEGRVWVWDRNERHWDVQEGCGYFRISHTGQQL
jgi:hypothetical protein